MLIPFLELLHCVDMGDVINSLQRRTLQKKSAVFAVRWAIKKFPKWWYCTVMIYGNAYLITFKV
jgi:hypothetical protein